MMNKQDKMWNDLSEEDKVHYKEQYTEHEKIPRSDVTKLLEELFGKHNLISVPTYEYIVEKLFSKGCYQFADSGNEWETIFNECSNEQYFLNFTSSKQAKKLIAINKLLNVAKYLNGYWKPDWNNDGEDKWYIEIWKGEISFTLRSISNSSLIYFHTEELARIATQILGKETILLALSTDY